jgi:hypothetical protein
MVSHLVLAGGPVLVIGDVQRDSIERSAVAKGASGLSQLLDKIKSAPNVAEEVQALRKLNDFSNKSATDVSSAVTEMLKNFNNKMGTSFTNLPSLISGMLSTPDTKTMMLQLQQAANSQLNDISTSLKQIEAENQAMIKFKQADIAEKEKQKSDFVKDAESVRDGFDATAKGSGSSLH